MSLSTNSAEDWLDDGHSHLAIGELEAAIECYQKAVQFDNQLFDGWHALAMTLLKVNRLKEATGAAMMATDLRPNDLLAWTALSQIHVKAGRIAEAEAAKSNAAILSLGGKIVGANEAAKD